MAEMKNWFLFLFCLCTLFSASAQERMLEEYLENGKLEAGRQVLQAACEARPQDHELRLQLGLAHFFRSGEQLCQEFYRRGLRSSGFGRMLPFFRLPLPENPQPTAASYFWLRQTLEHYRLGLQETIAILAVIPDDWQGKVPLRLGRVHFDIDGNGLVDREEALCKMVERLYGFNLPEKRARQFGMRLDAGDVRWLEGYCHLLSALTEVILAYDMEELFQHTGHTLFQRTDSPYQKFEGDDLLDLIAFIHLIQFPVLEPERLKQAHVHLGQVVTLSRRSWKCILAETDNDFEWIPGPAQRCVIPDWKVTLAMVDDWVVFLDEAQALLDGKSLLPFWHKVDPDFGINLRRMFFEPRPFDLILWVKGDSALAYLEKGQVSPSELWERLRRTFGSRFWGFAAWFN